VPQVGFDGGLEDEQVLGDLQVRRAAGGQVGDPEHLLDVFGEQRQRFIAVLHGFGAGVWAAATRCAGWSAHEVVRHLQVRRPDALRTDGLDATAYGVFIAAAVAPLFGGQVQEELKLAGDGGGIFKVDSRGSVTLTVRQAAVTGPLAAEVADALAGRSQTGAELSCLPAGSRTAPLHMADFFRTPAGS
jgi:hypothetical protein